MRAYVLKHLSDAVLLRDLATLVTQERTATAAVLAHIAEVDSRRLYLPAGFPSMFAYCVGVLRFSEDAAYKRIQAARAARQFPTIFNAVADGRLHLAGVCLLVPYLTAANADELFAAAAHRTKAEIELLLARRFPRTECLPLAQALSAPSEFRQLAPGQVEGVETPGRNASEPESARVGTVETAGVCVGTAVLAPGQGGSAAPRPRMIPIAPERFALQITLGQPTHDKLRYAQELLSHQIPSGDIPEVLDRALDVLIRVLEKQKFAATTRPRKGAPRATTAPRHIPASVKRAVWERDGGQCTFVSDSGQRCAARRFLEFDHVDEVARGGRASVHGIRLRCRPHNQYGAECTFGAGFMQQKREAARRVIETSRARAAEPGRSASSPADPGGPA